MCRPSCCDKPRSQAPGVAAVALIIGAGLAADKIGPHMARIVHDVADVLRIIALTTGILVAVAIAAWITTRLVRWRLTHRSQLRQVTDTEKLRLRPVRDERSCLACGGNGEVLRSDGAGRFELRACPECQPARLAG
jgi:hypothetical protein